MEAKSHRAKIISNLLKLIGNPNDQHNRHMIYVKGEELHNRNDTDVELVFRQESNFLYTTGVEDLHDSAVLIDVQSGITTLFVTCPSEDDIVWIGEPPSFDQIASKHLTSGDKVQDIKHLTQAIHDFLENCGSGQLFVLNKAHLPQTDIVKSVMDSSVNDSILAEAIQEARVFKTEWELEQMQHVNAISSRAHEELMKYASQLRDQPSSESLFESKWYSEGWMHGMKGQAYLPIIAYGQNAAVLHYGRNNMPIVDGKDGFLLVDAGYEYKGYASDITRTFPISGKFTKQQANIYNTVLNAQKTVISQLKPSVEWEDMHRLATVTICKGLIDYGIIKKPPTVSIEDLCWKHHIPQIFFPHGLGHLIGLDVHDVGGYPKGVQRIAEPAIRYLRMRRKLQPGMVVTVEPGCYFVGALLKKVTKEQEEYLDMQLIQQEYVKLGGVRIEDCVVITADGHLNLTSAVKEIKDIEKLMEKQ